MKRTPRAAKREPLLAKSEPLLAKREPLLAVVPRRPKRSRLRLPSVPADVLSLVFAHLDAATLWSAVETCRGWSPLALRALRLRSSVTRWHAYFSDVSLRRLLSSPASACTRRVFASHRLELVCSCGCVVRLVARLVAGGRARAPPGRLFLDPTALWPTLFLRGVERAAPAFYVEEEGDANDVRDMREEGCERHWQAIRPREFFAVAKAVDGTAVVFLPQATRGEMGYGGTGILAVMVDCSEGTREREAIWWGRGVRARGGTKSETAVVSF